MKGIILSTLLVFFTSQAVADFCPQLSFRYAKKAENYLKQRLTDGKKDHVVSWCDSCTPNDSSQALSQEITSVSARKVEHDKKRMIDPTAQTRYYNLVINDRIYDLGYTYINGEHIFDVLQREMKLKPQEIDESYCLENIATRSYVSKPNYQPLVIEAQEEANLSDGPDESNDLLLDPYNWNVVQSEGEVFMDQ